PEQPLAPEKERGEKHEYIRAQYDCLNKEEWKTFHRDVGGRLLSPYCAALWTTRKYLPRGISNHTMTRPQRSPLTELFGQLEPLGGKIPTQL
ncbi:MAG TPA: hypothetical protein VFO36_11500, partial [Nitrospiraceae bacterium]|nr:hypothetical protein [Nitrospiraceae bacterium]